MCTREISGVSTSVSAAVEQQGAPTQEIVRNVNQAAMDTREVTTTIIHGVSTAEEIGAAASQVWGASELSRQSEQLGENEPLLRIDRLVLSRPTLQMR